MVTTVRDKDIITKSFRMLASEGNTVALLDNYNWSNYFNVFSSATGDNRFVNPVTQFSPATDPRYDRFMKSSEGGMGPMYKTLYDNNATLLTIIPGQPEFAGLLSFITNMFDPVSAIMANKGRRPYLTFYIGQAASSIAFWPMQLFSVSLQFLQFLMDSPKNKFYTVKANMPDYIMMASGVLNDIMTRLGYIDPVLPNNQQQQTDPLYGINPSSTSSSKVALLNKMYSDVIYEDGTIDLFRLVARGARKHRFQLKALSDYDNNLANGSTMSVKQKYTLIRSLMEQTTMELGTSTAVTQGSPTAPQIEKYVKTVGAYRTGEGLYPEGQSAYLNEKIYADPNVTATGATGLGNDETGTNAIQSVQNQLMQSPPAANNPQAIQAASTQGTFSSATAAQTNPNEGGKADIPDANALLTDYKTPPSTAYADNTIDSSWAGGVYDYLKTALNGGLDALTFRVEGGSSPVSDTFSNSAGPSPIADKFNSIVRQAHDFNFDIAGGATGFGIIDAVVDRVKDLGSGLLAGSVLGNIPLALANNSYIKVPDHWQSASVNLHRESYEIASYCNYAHPYEQVMKIWVIFSLLLPLVAPVSSGGSSYTSPPLVKVFCQSRQLIRVGMVESMNFVFGEGECGWTRDRKPLNFKAQLNFVDLEPLVSVPINRALTVLDVTNPAAVVKRLSDDSAYNDYLGRLTGMSYLDTVLRYSRLNRMLTTAGLDFKSSFRADAVGAMLSDNLVGDVLRMFAKPIAR